MCQRTLRLVLSGSLQPKHSPVHGRDQREYSYKAVQRWTKPAKLKLAGQGHFKSVLEYQRLVIPINLNQTHWTCAVIDLKAQELLYFDSMHVRPPFCILCHAWQTEDNLKACCTGCCC